MPKIMIFDAEITIYSDNDDASFVKETIEKYLKGLRVAGISRWSVENAELDLAVNVERYEEA